jgi:hypothetical protein
LLSFLTFLSLSNASQASDENIDTPSTPLQYQGCSFDFLQSPKNRNVSLHGYYRNRIPFSGNDRVNSSPPPGSFRINLQRLFAGPQLDRFSEPQSDRHQYLITLNSVQTASLVKRACRWQWPVMGNILPEQKLTTEILQKIIDKLAEPVNSNVRRGTTGVRLREFNKKQEVTEKSISSETPECEEPWNELTTRKQRALLLAGVVLTQQFLDQLRDIMKMVRDDGEHCTLDEVFLAVLLHGSASARGGQKVNPQDCAGSVES